MMHNKKDNKKANYFLQYNDDDDADDEDYDYVENEQEPSIKQENSIKPKYEDKYKINKEIVDDELTQEKLEQLYNCFILENTPNGNALLLYNHKTSSFVYYSDNSIPYKYLNSIARKYVNTYRCKQLYINQEDEIEKQKAKEKEKEKEEENEMRESDKEKEPKKQIFAKFKTYNKNTTKIQSQHQHPHQQQTQNQTQKQEEVIANRYTYQGKLANFNFLKKPDKKLINKKLALSFSDYKKLNI